MTNIVISPSFRPASAPLINRTVAVVRTLWNRIQTERRLRATIHTLDGLNDDSLRDIGLERHDIGSVVRSRYIAR
jgi:uncharacterized protein YjiS (DUF1127 family)